MAGEGATRGPLVRSHMFVEEDGLTSVESAAPVFPTGHKVISVKGRAGLVLGCAAVAACLAALALWVGGAKPCVRSLMGGDVYIAGETADPEEKLPAAPALAARRLAAPGPSGAPANETAAPPATSGPAATGIETAEPPAALGPNATANESVAARLSPPGPNATADEAAVPEGAAPAAAAATAAVEVPNSTFAAALQAAGGNFSKALNLATPGRVVRVWLPPIDIEPPKWHDWTEDPLEPPASSAGPTRHPFGQDPLKPPHDPRLDPLEPPASSADPLEPPASSAGPTRHPFWQDPLEPPASSAGTRHPFGQVPDGWRGRPPSWRPSSPTSTSPPLWYDPMSGMFVDAAPASTEAAAAEAVAP